MKGNSTGRWNAEYGMWHYRIGLYQEKSWKQEDHYTISETQNVALRVIQKGDEMQAFSTLKHLRRGQQNHVDSILDIF
jgi:hypothetical protein